MAFALALSACGEENASSSFSSRASETPSEYKITWQNFDGEVLDINYVERGEYPHYQGDEPTRPEDEQYSYTFSGWTPKVQSAYGDATYKATYDGKVREYTITWEDYDGSVLREDVLAYGETPSYGQGPERTGDEQFSYTFSGWVPEITSVKGDQTYVANYESEMNKYKVIWEDYDGTVLLEEEWEYGSTPVYKGKEPKRERDAQYTYAFSGWESIDEGPLKKDRVYVAEYNSTKNEYQITWQDYDGTILRVDSVAYGGMPSYGKDPAREGDAQYTYTFSNWEPSVEKVTGDATYKAVYANTTNRYAVTWKDYDGTTLKVQSYDYGDVPSYGETPSRDPEPYESYAFEGWEPEIKEVVSDATYTAKYSKQTSTSFVISYDANGGYGAPTSQTKEKGGTLTIPSSKPSRTGYKFYGWNNLYEGKVYQPGDSFTGDINLTMHAMWLPLCPKCRGTGSIHEHVDEVVCSNCEGKGYFCAYCNEPLTVISDWSYSNHVYYYYHYCSSCGKKVFEEREMPSYETSKIVLDEKVMCTVCGGSGLTQKGYDNVYECDVLYVYDASPACLSAGARQITLEKQSGYEYSVDGENYQSSNVFSGLLPHTSYTFYQRRATSGGVPFGVPSLPTTIETTDASSYYVTYKLNGGENNSQNPATYQRSASSTPLYAPTKEGYDFAGWSYKGEIVSEIKGSWNVDIALEATWTPTGYAIAYDLQGGVNNEGNPETHSMEDAEITLKDPTRSGAVFVGWTGSNGDAPEKSVKIPANSTGELSYTANWELIEYSITYNLNGGVNSPSNPSSYNVESSFDLGAPTRNGYTFIGWQRDGNEVASISAGSTGDITLVARWELTAYHITYDLDGGMDVSSNPVEYTIESGDISFSNPTKTGYSFDGWYSDSAYSNKVDGVPAGSTGDMKFHAKWNANKNNLSVTSGDEYKGSVSVSGEGYTDEEITVTAIPADGYALKAWYCGESFVSWTGTYTFRMPAGDYSLTAEFCTEAEAANLRKALGIEPVIDTANKTLTYGLYPQTRVSDEATLTSLNALTTAESNGWYLLNGDYYAKTSAEPYSLSYVFNDGAKIARTEYWFKCEPITWKILSSTDDGEYFLVSTVLLDVHRYNERWDGADSDGYYANNYERSEIRSWLNGDFYNEAFSLDDSLIQTTTVDNSSSTTDSASNSYACGNTEDKVYLLSYKDYLNADYGFSTSSSACDTARQCKTTDWARANGALCFTSSYYLYNATYWIRSPSSSYSGAAWYVLGSGGLVSGSYYCHVGDVNAVRPGLTIKVSQ